MTDTVGLQNSVRILKNTLNLINVVRIPGELLDEAREAKHYTATLLRNTENALEKATHGTTSTDDSTSGQTSDRVRGASGDKQGQSDSL